MKYNEIKKTNKVLLIGKDFKGTGWNDSLVSGSKKAIKLKNQYDHPTLYEKNMKCFTQEG